MGKLARSGAFSRLKFLSTGAYLGWELDAYSDLFARQPRNALLDERNVSARQALSRFATSLDIGAACQWVVAGPLTFAITGAMNYRAHIQNAGAAIPVILGGKARWYWDVPLSLPAAGDELDQLLQLLSASLIGHVVERLGGYKKLDPSAVDRDPPIFLDIYLNGLLGEQPIVETLRKTVPIAVRKTYTALGVPTSRHVRDVFNFYPGEQAPPCEACGLARSAAESGECVWT